jgi:hypothetical protein
MGTVVAQAECAPTPHCDEATLLKIVEHAELTT